MKADTVEGGAELDELVQMNDGGVGGGGGGMANSSHQDIEFIVRESVQTGVITLKKLTTQLTEFPMQLLRISHLNDIHTLDLSGQSHLTDATLPAQLYHFKHLRTLRATNMAWRSLPRQVCDVATLQELVLSQNALTSLPDELCRLKELKKIDVSQNQFHQWPDVLTTLASTLTHVVFANNRLVSLPDDFCHRFCDTLQWLDLSTNRLTCLPDGWRWMSPRFEYLNLDNNQLGSVPLELGLLSGLRSLSLHGNPQKTVLYAVLAKGTPAILTTLKNKIPIDSPMLNGTDQRLTATRATEKSAHQNQFEASSSSSFNAQRDGYRRGSSGPSSLLSSHLSSNVRSTAAMARDRDSGRVGSRGSSVPSYDDYARGPSSSLSSSSHPSQSRSRPHEGMYEDRSSSVGGRAYATSERYEEDRLDARYSSASQRDYEPHPARSNQRYGQQTSPYPSQPPTDSYSYGRQSHSAYDRDDRLDDSSRRQDPYANARSSPPSHTSNTRTRDISYMDRDGRDYTPAGSSSSSSTTSSFHYSAASLPRPLAQSGYHSQSQAQPHRSSSGNASSAPPALRVLEQSILALTNELENNLSLGSLQKMKMRKELAGMKAELNRQQAHR